MKQETRTQKVKIRKGDKVRVIAGRDIGREAQVERVLRKEGRLVVTGINQLKKFVKKGREGEPSGVVTVSGSIDTSNVMLICPRCNKPVKVSFKVENGRRVRICRRCGKEVDVRKPINKKGK